MNDEKIREQALKVTVNFALKLGEDRFKKRLIEEVEKEMSELDKIESDDDNYLLFIGGKKQQLFDIIELTKNLKP